MVLCDGLSLDQNIGGSAKMDFHNSLRIIIASSCSDNQSRYKKPEIDLTFFSYVDLFPLSSALFMTSDQSKLSLFKLYQQIHRFNG
jgi:hypothetical protein